MATQLADLLVKMDVDSAKMRRELDNLARQVGGVQKTIKSLSQGAKDALESIGDKIKTALGAAAIYEAVKGFAELSRGTIDMGDKLDELSQKTGLSTESLSKLQYAAKFSSVDAEGLANGLKHLAKSSAEAAAGGAEQAAVFKRIGVAVKDSHGNVLPMDALLRQIADKFAGYEDGATKSALAQQIFGKAGADLLPVLNEGSAGLDRLGREAEKIGVVMSGDTAKKSAEFNDTMDRLHTHTQAVAMAVARELLPDLQSLASAWEEGKGGGKAYADTARTIAESLRAVASAGRAAKEAGEWLWDHTMKDQADWIALQVNGPTALNSHLNAFGSDAAALKERFKDYGREAAQAWRDGFAAQHFNMLDDIATLMHPDGLFWNPATKKKAPSGGGKGKSRQEQLRESLAAEMEEARKAVEGLETPFQKYAVQLQHVDDLEGKGLINEARAVEMRKALTKSYEEATPAAQLFAAELAKAASLVDALRTPQEKYDDEIESLNLAVSVGAISVQKYSNAVEEAGRTLEEHQTSRWDKQWEDFKAHSEALSREATETEKAIGALASGTTDVIATSLQEGFSRGLSGMLEDFSKMLQQMVARAIAAKLVAALFGAAGYDVGIGQFSGLASGYFTPGSAGYNGGRPGADGLIDPFTTGRVSASPLPTAGGGATAARTRQDVYHHHRFDDLATSRTLEQWLHGHLAELAATRGGR